MTLFEQKDDQEMLVDSYKDPDELVEYIVRRISPDRIHRDNVKFRGIRGDELNGRSEKLQDNICTGIYLGFLNADRDINST
ncbi:hypothetical protein JXA63_04890 [Candidatus Woesebacteria bacterium]|nr:hypothetical protein [Candidatus Woesebacteria bacterium]